MGIFSRNSGTSTDGGTVNGGDPRDMIGRNPTERPRRSSSGQRRKAARRLERDLEGTAYANQEDNE